MLFSILVQLVILLVNGLDKVGNEDELLLFSNYSTETNIMIKSNNFEQLKSVDKNEKPVVTKKHIHLNMKQGLIMNQVLNMYALDDVENDLCANHSLEFREGLRAFEPWALKMVDSSSKLPSGILMGNLMEFGSFKQCIHIESETPSGIIKGKHCTLKITPPLKIFEKILSYRNISSKRFKKLISMIEDAGFYWSVCIPDSCTTDDVLSHFSKNFESLGESLNLSVTLNEIDCYRLENELGLTKNQYIVISIILVIVGISLLCTLMDVCSKKRNEEELSLLIYSFSSYRNTKYIFSYNSEDKFGLKCLHGLRVLSTIYVILGHSYLMSLFAPTVNSLEIIEWLLQYSSTIIIGGTVSVDSFFMLSGLLVSYNTQELLNITNGKPNWFLFYIYRLIRLTPQYALAVLVHASLIQFIGSGPLWKRMYTAFQKPCQYFWWSAILNIQNYINPKHLCITQSWYLTDDFFFYLFSPLLIYPLWKWKIAGWINLFGVYIISIMVNFYLAWVNKYGAGMLVTNQLVQTKYFTKYYIAPHARASTYILGIFLGAILQKTKHQKIKLHPVTVTVGWIWSLVLMLSTILGNHIFQLEDHEYNKVETCVYLALSRSAWTIGVMWIVWACKQGYGGPVNYFLSNPVFQVVSKLTYSLYIWHLTLQFLSVGALKLPLYFSDYNVVNKFIGEFWIVLIFSVFYTIFFDCPIVRLLQYFKHQRKRISNKSEEALK